MEKSVEVPIMAVRQYTKLLDANIVAPCSHPWPMPHKNTASPRMLSTGISPISPYTTSGHYSREKLYQGMKEAGFEVSFEKWFTNPYSKGNTGSAALFIILDKLFQSWRIKKGERLLCFIPESGRFSHCFMMLTAV